MLVILVVAILWSNLCPALCQKSFPSNYPRCYRDDPELNQCLLKATEEMKPFLQKGIPEFNIPPISPFEIPEINLQQNTSAISYTDTLSRVVITGLDTYKFKKFDFDPEKLIFTGIVEMGEMNIRGAYSVQGKIFTVPIEGKGSFNMTILSSNGTLNQQAKLVTRKGIKYIESDKTVVEINVGEVKSDFNGLFDNNEVLAKAVRNVVNENLREIVQEVKPAVEEVLVRILNDVLFNNLAKVPYDELYPLHK